jgi:4-amino-4-deoxy-L-arabinose transferase-like glycosyltransferase
MAKKIFARDLTLILAIGLATRLAALPFAQVMEADAVWRVWHGWQWLDQPHWISHHVWGPVHTYLIAIALFVWGDPVWSPMVLHALAAVALAVALYLFTAEEFDPRAALAVAMAGLFNPLGFRNSLMPLAEIWVCLFVVTAVLAVGRLRRGRAGAMTAIWGGLSLTLACGLRFEIWLLIPILAAMLRRRPAILLVFGIAALVFPAAWMMSSYAATGDPLWSVHASSHFAADVAGLRPPESFKMLSIRLGFYPLTLVQGLTPVLAAACLAGMASCLRHRRPQSIWLVPLVALLLALIVACLKGSITLKGRYLLTCATLNLPFLAELRGWAVIGAWSPGRRRLLTSLLIVTAFPLGYIGTLAPGLWPSHYWKNIAPIPRVSEATRTLSASLNAALETGDGVVVDFIDWQTTEYLGLATRLHPDRVLILKGAENSAVNVEELAAFLREHPRGMLVLSAESRFRRGSRLQDDRLLDYSGQPWRLELRVIARDPRATLYRYRALEAAAGEERIAQSFETGDLSQFVSPRWGSEVWPPQPSPLGWAMKFRPYRPKSVSKKYRISGIG